MNESVSNAQNRESMRMATEVTIRLFLVAAIQALLAAVVLTSALTTVSVLP